MKIVFNFNAFFISIFSLIFPIRKISKNINFKANISKIQMNDNICQISNEIVGVLGFENANF